MTSMRHVFVVADSKAGSGLAARRLHVFFFFWPGAPVSFHKPKSRILLSWGMKLRLIACRYEPRDWLATSWMGSDFLKVNSRCIEVFTLSQRAFDCRWRRRVLHQIVCSMHLYKKVLLVDKNCIWSLSLGILTKAFLSRWPILFLQAWSRQVPLKTNKKTKVKLRWVVNASVVFVKCGPCTVVWFCCFLTAASNRQWCRKTSEDAPWWSRSRNRARWYPDKNARSTMSRARGPDEKCAHVVGCRLKTNVTSRSP